MLNPDKYAKNGNLKIQLNKTWIFTEINQNYDKMNVNISWNTTKIFKRAKFSLDKENKFIKIQQKSTLYCVIVIQYLS